MTGTCRITEAAMLSLHRTLLIEEGRIIAALLKDFIAKRPLLIQSKKASLQLSCFTAGWLFY
jgi:hypothetical protein